MDYTLIDALENNKFAELTKDFETIIAKKIETRIEEKKTEILDTINGVKKNTEETKEEPENKDGE